MDEFSLIRSISQDYYKQPSLIKGVGDDTAVFRQSAKDIVTAVDTFVEDVHFLRSTVPPFYIGYRALAANISDLAAMGSTPAFYLVSIIIPPSWSQAEIKLIFAGMNKIASIYKMDLIGGDTVTGKELSISITVIGYVAREKSRYRSLARNDDVVFVTGTLGDSQAGLYVLQNDGDFINKNYFIEKHQQPVPRVEFAHNLNHLSRVVLNDISDGIASETVEIAKASNVSITIYPNKLPISNTFNQFPKTLQDKWKLFGGEDFELVGTVPKKDWDEVKQVAYKAQINITKIGFVESKSNKVGNVYLSEDNQKSLLEDRGYMHF